MAWRTSLDWITAPDTVRRHTPSLAYSKEYLFGAEWRLQEDNNSRGGKSSGISREISLDDLPQGPRLLTCPTWNDQL